MRLLGGLSWQRPVFAGSQFLWFCAVQWSVQCLCSFCVFEKWMSARGDSSNSTPPPKRALGVIGESAIAAATPLPGLSPLAQGFDLSAAFAREREVSKREVQQQITELGKALGQELRKAVSSLTPPPTEARPPASAPAPQSPPPTLPPPGRPQLSREEALSRLDAEHAQDRRELDALFGNRAPPGAVSRQLHPTFVDAARPIRQSPLGFNQQLSAGGTEASKIAVVPDDQGFVPCNAAYRVGKRPTPRFNPGAPTEVRRFSPPEWHTATGGLWTQKKPGSQQTAYTARDKKELETLSPAVDAFADTLGYLAGDPAGRIGTALPVLKSCFEMLADRRGEIEAAAYGDMGWTSLDRAATFRVTQTDDEEQFMARELPPRIAGRLIAHSAKTTEAIFNESAKARARAAVAAGLAGGAPASSPKKRDAPGGNEAGLR